MNKPAYLLCLSLFLALFAGTPSIVSADNLKNGMMAFQAGDYEQALKMWQPLAEEGNMVAQFSLGMMYHEGYGVQKNEIEAANWFMKSAEQGFAPAQFNLGNAYKFGRGLQKNTEMAIDWWHKAAEQESSSAQFNLAIAYYYGDGVAKNEEEGMKWFRKAAANNHPEARKKLETELSAKASPPLPKSNISDKPPVILDESDMSPMTQKETTDIKVSEPAPVVTTIETQAETPVAALPDQTTSEDTVETKPEASDFKLPASALMVPVKAEIPAETAPVKNIMPETWVLSQSPSDFTIQLISGSEKNAVEDYARKNGLDGIFSVCSYTVKDKLWYALVYNVYPSGTEARKALAELPQDIKKRSPWVRKFQELQSTITRSKPGLE